MGETPGWGSDCTPETASSKKKSLGNVKRAGQTSVRRIIGRGGAVFPSGAQDSGVIQIEVPETIISSPSLKRKRADRPFRVNGAGRVLDLVVDALGELRGQAYTLANRLELPRIGAALRRCKIDQCGADFSQRLGGPRFRLRRGIALPLRHDKPQETPNCG